MSKIAGLGVEASGLSKSFGKREVLQKVGLKLEAGRFHTLLGENGAGKSTLIRILMNYEAPSEGTYRLTGGPTGASLRGKVGLVSEDIQIHVPTSLRAFVQRYASFYAGWDPAAMQDVVGRQRLDLSQRFEDLSRGQKMQFVLSLALAARPSLILVDEVTAVMDANARAYHLGLLREYVSQGGTVVMATNIPSDMDGITDHLLVLHEGRLALDLGMSDLDRRYVKLRRSNGVNHPIFEDPSCVYATRNSDGSSSYVLPAEAAAKYDLPGELRDRRTMRIAEVFAWVTDRMREGRHAHAA